jgi:hypothetical protein
MKLKLLATAILVATANVARAEELVLIDGRYLQVSVLEADKSGLRVIVFQTNGEIFIPWDRVVERDRDRLMTKWDLKEVRIEAPTESGVRIATKSGDVLVGRVVKQTPEAITLRRNGVDEEYKREMIKEMEQELVPVTAIEKPETLYAERVKQANPAEDDIDAHVELAEFAESIDLPEEAIRHYLRVQAIDPEFEAQRIKNRLISLEALAQNKNVREAIQQARRFANATLFKRSLQTLADLNAIPNLPDPIKAELGIVAEWVVAKQSEYQRVAVRDQFLREIRIKIAAMSRDEKLTLQQAQAELRTKVGKEIFAKLAERLEIDHKKVEELWKDRRLHADRFTSYGSGSFIVLGVAAKAQEQQQELQRLLMQDLNRRGQQGRGNDQGGSLQSQAEKLPKPPTKEEWWKRSKSYEREEWMFCYWVEHAKLVEIPTTRGERWDDCVRCGGTGALPFAGSQGETIRVTCPSCQGHKGYKGFRFK